MDSICYCTVYELKRMYSAASTMMIGMIMVIHAGDDELMAFLTVRRSTQDGAERTGR